MSLPHLLARYSVAGVINGVVCCAAIFSCMAIGIGPGASNATGYLAGMITSFLQSRHWVFRSTGNLIGDGLRFIVVFAFSYGMNLIALRVLIDAGMNAYLAQIASCAVYVAMSFALNWRWVFRKRGMQKEH
ncbi:MAG: GtrA family protein [Rudaea sp.]